MMTSSFQSTDVRRSVILVVFLISVAAQLYATVAAGEICFRKYDQSRHACKMVVIGRATGVSLSYPSSPSSSSSLADGDNMPVSGVAVTTAETCCRKYGEGYATKLQKLKQRQRWYECSPCTSQSSPPSSSLTSHDVIASSRSVITSLLDAHRKPPEVGELKRITPPPENVTGRDYFPPAHDTDDAEEYHLREGMEGEGGGAEEGGRTADDADRELEYAPSSDSSEEAADRQSVVSNVAGNWSEWSACSRTCGPPDGTERRNRQVCPALPPAATGGRVGVGVGRDGVGGGLGCVEEFEERTCHLARHCPINGGWSAWETWSNCNETCGAGWKSRSRTCSHPSPAHRGVPCSGLDEEIESCKLKPCPIDGGWSDWLTLPCSVTCGEGHRVVTRSCDNPPPTDGGLECEGEAERVETCENPRCPVNGGWSPWSVWSRCPAVCGEGAQTRYRTCTNPSPEDGGRPCEGLAQESTPCVSRTNCPVNGNWSEWSRWDICSATPCSGLLGHRVRFRTCTNPRPMFGGRLCRGRTWSRQSCYSNDYCTQTVDGGWCEWQNWTSCVNGVQTKTRNCNCPPSVNGGATCSGDGVKDRACDLDSPLGGAHLSVGGITDTPGGLSDSAPSRSNAVLPLRAAATSSFSTDAPSVAAIAAKDCQVTEASGDNDDRSDSTDSACDVEDSNDLSSQEDVTSRESISDDMDDPPPAFED